MLSGLLSISIVGAALLGGGGISSATPNSFHSIPAEKIGDAEGLEAGSFMGLKNPRAIAVDQTGIVYVADRDLHSVIRYEAKGIGIGVPILENVSDPTGIAVDKNGDIYVTDGGGVNSGSVLKIEAGGRISQVFNPAGWHNPSGVALDLHGNLYVSDNGGSFGTPQVIRFTDGVAHSIGNNWITPNAITVDANSTVYVVDDGDSSRSHPARVIRLTGNGVMEPVSSGWRYPAGIAADPDGTLHVADHSTQQLIRVSTDGARSIVWQAPAQPSGLGVGPGVLYILDPKSKVTRFDR